MEVYRIIDGIRHRLPSERPILLVLVTLEARYITSETWIDKTTGPGTGGGFYLIVSCLFMLLSFGVSCPVSFLSE